MARSQPPDVEILVHAAAPSRTADDAVYRQLAQAYLSFRPCNRTTVSSPRQQQGNEHKDDAGEAAGPPKLLVPRHVPSSTGQQGFAAAASSQAFVPESQDLSFQSVVDNRSSPPLRVRCNFRSPRRVEEHSSSQASSSSWCAPPSRISDSCPSPDARILHLSPTRALERYLKGFRSSARELSESSPPPRVPTSQRGCAPSTDLQHTNILSSIPVPDPEEDSSQSLSHVSARQVIPVTPVVPGALSRKRLQPVQAEDHAIVDETHISSSAISHVSGRSSSPRAESAPLPSKRQKTIADKAGVLNLLRSSSDVGMRRPASSSSAALIKDFGDASEIRPPSPPVGVVDIQPPSLVSEKLAKLARDLSSRYRPEIRREIDPFERGYWLLDCAAWREDTRLEAWVFLDNYLRSGLAGWGVWCCRDSSHGWIRLYCWGHLAKHTYLLLYLASGRLIKATGAEWLGADGEVVLEVPPAERQA